MARWATHDLRPHLTVVLDLPPRARPGPVRGARPDRGRVGRVPRAGARGLPADGRGRARALPRRSTPGCRADEIADAVRARVRAAARPGPPGAMARLSVWDTLVGQRPIIDALRCSGRRAGDDPRLAVHRAARVGPLQRGRWPSRPRCSASERGCGRLPRLPHRAGRLPRRRDAWCAPRSCPSESTRSATWSAARRWRRSGRGFQVMVVEDADRLTDQACNALLKAIEEPTARTVWLLCAPTVEDVLPTIRSRCRLIGLDDPGDRGGRATSWCVPKGCRRRWRPTPPAPARGTSAGPGRWPGTRRPATGAARWSTVPSRLTSLGACMTAAAQPPRGDARRRPSRSPETLTHARRPTSTRPTAWSSGADGPASTPPPWPPCRRPRRPGPSVVTSMSSTVG